MSATGGLVASSTTPDTVHTVAENELRAALRREGYFGGARLLVSDSRVVYLLLNDARGRVMERVFGVPKDKSALLTVVALATLAQAVHDKAERVFNVPGPPSQGDTVLVAAALNEALHGIAGAGSRDAPFFGALVTIALLGASVRPALRASFRGIRAVTHDARADFDHRYGHLIRPNRRRA
jgi:hypothetical protein